MPMFAVRHSCCAACVSPRFLRFHPSKRPMRTPCLHWEVCVFIAVLQSCMPNGPFRIVGECHGAVRGHATPRHAAAPLRCAQNSRHKQRQRFSVDAAQYRPAADAMATAELVSGSATIRFFAARAEAVAVEAAAAPVTLAARGPRLSLAVAAMLAPVLF